MRIFDWLKLRGYSPAPPSDATKYLDGTGAWSVPAGTAPAESAVTFTDITTNNSSTSKHGYLLKLDNNAAHYMDGTGAWSTPAGGGGGALSWIHITGDNTTESHAASGWHKVSSSFTTVVQNSNTWWDTTNKKFLPTTAGKYMVQACVTIQGMANQEFTVAAIYKNGSILSRGVSTTVSTGATSSCQLLVSAVVSCNGSTDYVEIYIYNGSGSSRNVGQVADSHWVQAYFLGT